MVKTNLNIFSNFYVGIDIGRYKIDGVKIKHNGKRSEIIAVHSVPYSNKVFDGDELVNENEIINGLAEIGRSLKIDIEDFITTAIFSDKVLFRQLKMPNMRNKRQIIEASKFQIVKELSISSSNITVDVDLLGEGNGLSISAFIVRNEDIEKFKSFFVRSNLPIPDILDAGYFKFNYLLEEKVRHGLSFFAFEDSMSTYLQIFRNGKFLSIDSVTGGSEELNNDIDARMHYLQLSDDVQRLTRILISRYGLSNENIENFICISERNEYLNEWVESLKEMDLGKVSDYYDFVSLKREIPAGAYSMAMRGALENAKGKLLHKEA
ncbi:type IV pilus biogenesis protein PilM [Athalassotoga saccharophila]|uniref:hypothetical protein n=1 Tax=Athalassotoga saccharophila TaxID=1441386 RepID=UPI0013799438|nr:hypothetical protein [Athalassotoga saccharophila]